MAESFFPLPSAGIQKHFLQIGQRRELRELCRSPPTKLPSTHTKSVYNKVQIMKIVCNICNCLKASSASETYRFEFQAPFKVFYLMDFLKQGTSAVRLKLQVRKFQNCVQISILPFLQTKTTPNLFKTFYSPVIL